MNIRNLAEVGTRLEEAIMALPEKPTGPAYLFEKYQVVVTQILDSEFADHPPGLLEEYLMTRLYLKQLEMGLLPLVDSREQ